MADTAERQYDRIEELEKDITACVSMHCGIKSILAQKVSDALLVNKNTLDPDDPFDSAVIKLVAMNRKKRADYAADSDWASNFRDVSGNLAMQGFGPAESAYVLLLTKVARLRSLRLNGRMDDPNNESVLDTYLDLAVYAIIVFALINEQSENTDD